MGEKQRYRLRPRSVALTRAQWWISVFAVAAALVGLVLAVTGTVLGSGLMGAAAVTGGLTVALGGRWDAPEK